MVDSISLSIPNILNISRYRQDNWFNKTEDSPENEAGKLYIFLAVVFIIIL
jgi:hypothetical protein